ncbi:MAG: biopolymer transporter ExbD [Candidatus Omnitrophica bacterium]|nr:biopolymer transporter ExbD [Candidatus Omnitrophota bacterium]
MKFSRHLQYEYGVKQLLLVPLVNLLFLLVVFLLVVSPLVDQPGLKVRLPGFVTTGIVAGENIEIVIAADGAAYYRGAGIRQEELAAMLMHLWPRQITVLIKAHKDAPLGAITQIWDTCRRSRVTRINVATSGIQP